MKKKCKIAVIVLIVFIILLSGIIIKNVCLTKSKEPDKNNLFTSIEQYQELVEEGYKVKVKYDKEDKNNYYFKSKDNMFEVNKKTGDIIIYSEKINVVKPE